MPLRRASGQALSSSAPSARCGSSTTRARRRSRTGRDGRARCPAAAARTSGRAWSPGAVVASPALRRRSTRRPGRSPRRRSRGRSPRRRRRVVPARRSPSGAVRRPARGNRRAAGLAASRRRGGDSGTTRGGRRAARGRGSLDPAPREWRHHRCVPVTASHRSPVSRERIDVSSRNVRTASGCRCSTSSRR